jgi:cell division protein YceG involved in septum cleavage
MTVKEIGREMAKDKLVSPNTIILNLQKYKNVFERIEKGVYVLKSDIKSMDEDQFKAYIQSQK